MCIRDRSWGPSARTWPGSARPPRRRRRRPSTATAWPARSRTRPRPPPPRRSRWPPAAPRPAGDPPRRRSRTRTWPARTRKPSRRPGCPPGRRPGQSGWRRRAAAAAPAGAPDPPCHPRDARLTVPYIIADGSRITAFRHAELPAQRACGAQSGRSYVRSSGARVGVIAATGPTVLQPLTADVSALVRAVSKASTSSSTAAPGAAMRLAADQVATGPAGQRAVALVGTPLATQHEAEITNAALDGRLVGTPVYVLGDADGVTAATRQTLEFTGGTSYAGAAGSPLS